MQNGRLFSERLLQFFQNNIKLTSLSATHQLLGIGSSQLSSMLTTKPTSLKYLDLSYVEMNDESCRRLCLALEANHLGLRSLELNGNRLKHGGCAAVATLLSNPNCVLNRLCLEHNKITNQGAVALSNGLMNNKHLKTLSLHGNNAMTLQGMKSFVQVLNNTPNVTDIINSNHTLQSLTLPVRAISLRQNAESDKESKLSKQYSLRFNNRGSSNQILSSSNNGSSKNKASCIINQKVVLHHFIFNPIFNYMNNYLDICYHDYYPPLQIMKYTIQNDPINLHLKMNCLQRRIIIEDMSRYIVLFDFVHQFVNDGLMEEVIVMSCHK